MKTNLFYKFIELGNLARSYYSIRIYSEELFGAQSKKKCKEFIEKHFAKGSKLPVIQKLDFNEKYDTQGKHEHTVALYLLGLTMQSLFMDKICNSLDAVNITPEEQNEEYDVGYDFKYYWYLTCLFHDVASCVERNPSPCEPCCRYCPKRQFPHGKLARYDRETVENYCNYRKNLGEQDHGILGGIMLYDKLCSNFRDNTEGKALPVITTSNNSSLIWRNEHKDIYAYVANAIICHNMWTVNESDEAGVAKYHDLGLDKLIISKEEDKLSIDDYPLNFMLCLLDSIEPVKRFKKLSAREVLENVSIEAENGEITIAWTDKMKKQADFWDWMKNISTMKDWMQVDVSSCEREGEWCYVTVTIR